MGQVAVTLVVMPSSPEISLKVLEDNIRNQISDYGEIEIKSASEKPVAFGLKALELLIILPDAEGGTDKLEEEISSVEGVESVQIDNTTLI